MTDKKKILIEAETGKKYLVKNTKEDFHTASGFIQAKDLEKEGMVKSNTGKKFVVMEPNFVDLWEKLKRGPQVVLPKDIGLIITKTGINKNSRVVDAGGGSGSLCCYLANICREVVSYEKKKELVKLLEQNKDLFGLRNLIIRNKDIYQGIREREQDLITLDLAEPWRVVRAAEKALKLGGFLAVYLPNLVQVKKFVDSLRGSKVWLLGVEELLERKWKIEGEIMRPEFEMLGHTGFLCFGRKVIV